MGGLDGKKNSGPQEKCFLRDSSYGTFRALGRDGPNNRGQSKDVSRFIGASRTPPWLLSGWECLGRRLSIARENPCRRRAPERGRHRHLLPARLSLAEHWREPLRDAPALLSSSSRRFRCGRES